MTGGFIARGLLLMLAFPAYAGAGPWSPDFSPQCKRDENLRNTYLEAEQKAVANSLSELEKRGLNIIPAPKNLAFAGQDLRVPRKDIAVLADKSAQVAVDLIARKLGRPVVALELGAAAATEISIVLLRKDLNAGHPLLPADIPDFYQGYVIKTHEANGQRTYVLAGRDQDGLLYAAVTFCRLIAAEGEAIVLPGVQVSDWPDVRYRMGGGLLYPYRQNFVYSSAKSPESAKRFIDWLLEHKINMTEATIHDFGGNRLYFPYTEEGIEWLREICDYAQARGVYVTWFTFSAVGDDVTDKGDAAFRDWACVEHLGLYQCWSNDDLIAKRARKMVRYLKATGQGAIYIHSIDTGNAKWEDRCPQCRARFGGDRFSGDANVFTRYRDEIRKSFPEMPVTIVPRPYSHGVADVKNLEEGEMQSKDDMERFGKIIPADIYICHRCDTTSRAGNLSWVHTLKQPLFSCVMGWYGCPTLEARDFTPICRYYRSYNYPLSDEIANYGVSQSDTRDKIQCLGFAEFTWNLNSPGSREYAATPAEYCADIWDPFGDDLARNKDLQAVVRRSCDDLFGKKAAKYFYNVMLLFADSYFANNYQEVVYELRNGYMSSGKGLMRDIGDQKGIEFMRRVYRNSEIIIRDMEAAKKEVADPQTSALANSYVVRFAPVRAVAHVNMLALEADQASRKGEHDRAARLVEETFKTHAAETEQLRSDWLRLQGQKRDFLNEAAVNIPPDAPGLEHMRNALDMLKVKVAGRALVAQRKQGGAAAAGEPPRENKPIRAAVFAPDLKGGLTYGRKGLVNLLKGISDISVEEIDNLALDTMKQYDCVIFPDCKSLGSVTVSVPDIRAYVVDHGGGMYFEHDSCGFNRFPLQDSVFPEIANVEDRVGEPPISTKYKAGERIFKIAGPHPVTAGNLVGSTFEQVYFDHLQLVNETGTILVEDSCGKSVVVAGRAGNGRVVFNGGITLDADKDRELDTPLATVEGEIIVNSVRWLAKDKKGTEIIMAGLKKTEKTLPDRQASVITFKPQIIPCKPLHDVVLTAQCFNARDLRPISPKTEIARVGALAGKWEAEENVIINAESYPRIKIKLELSSREGYLATLRIISDRE